MLILVLLFGIVVAINSSSSSSSSTSINEDLNQINAELKQLDNLLGVVINKKQRQLWEEEVENGDSKPHNNWNLFGVGDESYFYDIFYGWANDRFYRLLDCPVNQVKILFVTRISQIIQRCFVETVTVW